MPDSFSTIATCFLVSLTIAIGKNEGIVTIPHKGRIQGVLQDVLDKQVTAYLGVPYGQPPTGKLRFERPRMIQTYSEPDGVLKCTEAAKSCFGTLDNPGFRGTAMWNPPTPFTENCLNLNIWVPQSRPYAKYPVLVWIFGGGFFGGSPSLDLYNGSVLAAEKELIVVNINYRLGPFGFLYLSGTSANGNMGLFDQQLAIQWIQKNIGYFGGDPGKITLAGESAGAAGVSAHLMSNVNYSGINGVMLLSGSMMHNWASQKAEEVDQWSRKLASNLGCYMEDAEELLTCVRGHSAAQLQDASLTISVDRIMESPFVPILDADLFGARDDHSFFREGVVLDGRVNFSTGNFLQVPVLVGSVANEGTFFLPYSLATVFNWEAVVQGCSCYLHYGQYLEAIQKIFENSSSTVHSAIACVYQRKFGPPGTFCPTSAFKFPELRDAVGHILGDTSFGCVTFDFAKMVSEFVDVYFYYFDHVSSANAWPEWMGSMHGYEIEYFFGYPLRRPELYRASELNMERKVARNAMDVLAAFAKHKKPKNWLKFQKPHFNQNLISDDNSLTNIRSWEECKAFKLDREYLKNTGCDIP